MASSNHVTVSLGLVALGIEDHSNCRQYQSNGSNKAGGYQLQSFNNPGHVAFMKNAKKPRNSSLLEGSKSRPHLSALTPNALVTSLEGPRPVKAKVIKSYTEALDRKMLPSAVKDDLLKESESGKIAFLRRTLAKHLLAKNFAHKLPENHKQCLPYYSQMSSSMFCRKNGHK